MGGGLFTFQLNKYSVTEYENYKDSKGHIVKVNFWAFNARESSRELFQVEQNAEYKDDKLISFTRHQITKSGEITNNEKCSLFYDSSGKLTRIVRTDLASGFSTAFRYFYDSRGFVNHCSVDFIVEIQEYGKNQVQDIYYDCDKHGNWISKYRKADNKIQVEAKREIRYR